MKILLTGGTGFVGRHIAWRLAAEGCEVVFSGRNRDAADEVLRHARAAMRFLPIEHGTPQARAALAEAARGADALVHCAALSAPWGSAEAFQRANVASTEEVINACRTQGVARLVHLSTPSLYFDFQDRLGVRENDPLPPPVNHYAHTKGMAEALLRAADVAPTVVLRPRAVFGPWDATLMPRMLRVMRRGAIPLMRGGRAELDLTYIDNLVDAAWLGLTRPLPGRYNLYNVSNAEPIRLDHLLERVATAFALPLRTRRLPWPLVSAVARLLETDAHWRSGEEPLLTRYSAGVLAFSQTLDTSAIRRELGWQPRIDLAEGIRRHAAWWLEQGR
ncbi:NAD-dependent epimerase/dehydratase family protein [Pseudomonas sp.]|uniref:NAD-dependent epimerase/dehydratase family protein n=1 Tax=Pseudomonas sp. TaxID=306 RepID=UPI003A986BE9